MSRIHMQDALGSKFRKTQTFKKQITVTFWSIGAFVCYDTMIRVLPGFGEDYVNKERLLFVSIPKDHYESESVSNFALQ